MQLSAVVVIALSMVDVLLYLSSSKKLFSLSLFFALLLLVFFGPKFTSIGEFGLLGKRDILLRLSGKCSPNGKFTDRLAMPKILLVVLLCCKVFFDVESCNIDDLLEEMAGKQFCAFPISSGKELSF